jgi:hypothetical protein
VKGLPHPHGGAQLQRIIARGGLGASWDQKNPENKEDHAKQDEPAGLYYQPTVGQSFEIIFVRMNP